MLEKSVPGQPQGVGLVSGGLGRKARRCPPTEKLEQSSLAWGMEVSVVVSTCSKK